MKASNILAQLNVRLFDLLIKPHATDVDAKRQEYILNVLLSALATVTTFAIVISTYHAVVSDRHHATSLLGTLIFSVVIYSLVILSRHGHYRISSYLFIGLLSLTGTQLLWAYSFELPSSLMAFALTIVISSVLLNARTGLLFAGLIAIVELTVGYFQLTHHLQPDISWFEDDFNLGDAISYSCILGLIGVVAWLSNREIDRSLRRARTSEAALAAERDNLEVKVIERTRELEQTQLLRMMELQRFAEFGRLSANLLHELASPLTAASLNLQQFSNQEPRLVSQVQRNLQQIERYVVSARQQMQSQSTRKRFAIKSELVHLNDLLQPVARDNQIKLTIKQHGRYWLYGDPVKFNQLVRNLVLNAIDASRGNEAASKIIVDVSASSKWVILTVSDWGSGIAAENLTKVFDPLYTTKTGNDRGMGIGLAMVREFAEKEFHGSVTAHTSKADGTVFTVKLKRLTR